MEHQQVVQRDGASGETRTLIRRFTDELLNDEPENTLAQSLKDAVEERDQALELATPWRSQYEAPITV